MEKEHGVFLLVSSMKSRPCSFFLKRRNMGEMFFWRNTFNNKELQELKFLAGI